MEFRLDGLRLTVWEGRARVLQMAADLVGADVAWEEEGGGSRYRRSDVLVEGGVRVFSDPVDGGGHCSLVVEGAAWERLPMEQFAEWGAAVLRSGVRARASRVDLAWDHVAFEPHALWDAAGRDDVRSLAKRDSARMQLALPGYRGNTFTWGSRSSERFLRCYDAHGFTRVELELKGDRAALVLEQLLALDVAGWERAAMGHLRDFLDVVDRGACKDISAAPLLPWWAEFVRGAEKARLRLGVLPVTLERAMAWVRWQVAPTLYALEQACGSGFVDSLTAAGGRRVGLRQRVLMAQGARVLGATA